MLISFLLFFFFFSSHTQAQQTIPEISDVETITLKKHYHMFFIEIHINKKKANLLVDTGAAYTILDINQAKKYGYEYHDTDIEIIGIGGRLNRFRLTNYNIEHNESKLIVRPYGADLNIVAKSFSDHGLNIVGIIGSDFFTTAQAVIDYKENKLILNKH
ncbi:MAG: hypothetical protein HC836_35300 [Richelia sp. RM2_1_2]|nr:hypothetical protein [Richelia sp. RM2_1_2]